MQSLDIEVIKLLGVKPFTQRLEQIVHPTCVFHNPTITLRFPYSKSDSRTRFLQFSHEGIDIECWADEEGFIFEVNLLTYNIVNISSVINLVHFEIGIPFFEYGQTKVDLKTIRRNNSEIRILLSKDDLLVQIQNSDLLTMKWIGIGRMYFGINDNKELCGFLFKGIDFAGYL